MKQSSEGIVDQVLAGFRDAEPEAGMQERIVHALRQRPAQHAARRFAWPVSGKPRVFPFATICVAAALLIAVFLTHKQPRHIDNTAQAGTPQAPLTVSKTTSNETFRQPAIRKSRPVTYGPSAPKLHLALSQRSMDEDQLLADMRAPSQPAPELPLTRQERLLLRYANHGQSEEVAIIKPLTLPFRNPVEEAEFQTFFHPPIPPQDANTP